MDNNHILRNRFFLRTDVLLVWPFTGASNENIVQNHLNVALSNAFWYLNGTDISIFSSPTNFSSVLISQLKV